MADGRRMIRIVTYFCFLLFACAAGVVLAIFLPLKAAPVVAEKGNLAIIDVNIVDTIAGNISLRKTVLIEQGRIIEVLAAGEYQPRANFREIPARDKYLMPGLWDMHTHSLKLSPQLHHPLFIRYGVTSIRDMSGCLTEPDSYWACPEDRRRWEREAIIGERVSPRYHLQSSYQTNGGNEVPKSYPDFFRLDGAADAEQLVDFYAGQKVDFVKTYTELSATQFDSVVRSASGRDISLAGHKPLAISLPRALAAGMDSIEHGRLFLFECYAGIEAFRQLESPISHYDAQFMRQMLQNQDRELCSELMEAMAKSDATWVPTLTTLKMSAKSREPTFREDPRLKYIPYIVRKLLWEQDINRASLKGYDAEQRFVHEDFFAAASEHVGLANRFGIKLLAGTDNIDTHVFSGASLHDELHMLVEAGLSPHEVIQSATIDAARFADLDTEFGTVELGKNADLVLLNANPLVDIRHSKSIEGVVFAGQYFDSNALNELDQYAVDMAGSLQLNVRFLFDILASPLMRAQLAD
ncbi:MAG: amidohydrolase family protein [Halioglobus sp.]